jgi:flagellar biosynthesis/type III secretory pathway chaperone
MNDSLQCLIQALQNELGEYGALLHLFEQQQNCVLRHDSTGYLELNLLVEEQMATLARCRSLRQGLAGAVAREYGKTPETPIIEMAESLPAPRRPLIRALVEEINRLVERARRRAQQNQLLLARCIDTARSVISTLRPGETYSAQGKTQSLRGAPVRIAAVA